MARELGIKLLWAGGITLPQAYEFGTLGVFGVYVTSAASKAVRVGRDYRDDPALAASKQPTYDGVLRVKTLLEAGFLETALDQKGIPFATERQRALQRIRACNKAPQELAGVLPAAWRLWWRIQKGRSNAA